MFALPPRTPVLSVAVFIASLLFTRPTLTPTLPLYPRLRCPRGLRRRLRGASRLCDFYWIELCAFEDSGGVFQESSDSYWIKPDIYKLLLLI